MDVAEYRSLVAPRPKRRNSDPEHRLQCAVVRRLLELLRLGALRIHDFTASAAGVRMPSIQAARRLKEAGVRRGWADLQFACLDGLTRYIEIKVHEGDGQLSDEQKAFRAWAEPLGIWAKATSVQAVEDALRGWGLLIEGAR